MWQRSWRWFEAQTSLEWKLLQWALQAQRKEGWSWELGKASEKVWPLCRYYFLFSCSSPLQSCLTFCDPMDHSPLGSSVLGIVQARILGCVAVPSFRDLPDPGIEPMSLNITCTGGGLGSLPPAPPGNMVLSGGLPQQSVFLASHSKNKCAHPGTWPPREVRWLSRLPKSPPGYLMGIQTPVRPVQMA